MLVREILNSIGYRNLSDSGDFFRTKPIYRNSKTNSALSINKKTGWFTDFATGESGPMAKLVQLTTGCSTQEAEKIAGGLLVEAVENQKQTEIVIPERIREDELQPLLPNYNFYKRRGISEETLKVFETGLATYGKMSDRFVFPIFDLDKRIVGLAGRDVTGKKEAKWKIIGRKNNFVYPLYLNKNYIEEKSEIILVESIGDMIALWENGVRNTMVLFGVALLKGHLMSILALNVRKIIIATNNDQDNMAGQNAAVKIEKQLLQWFTKDRIIVKLPTKNDFGDMTAAEIADWAAA